MLNRWTDGGATWTLNSMAGRIIVPNADSTRPTPKFGTVNALLGGSTMRLSIQQRGYLLGLRNRDPGTGNDRLAIRRIQDNGGGGVTVGPENFVTGRVEPPVLRSLGSAIGTVGVFYYTFDGCRMELPIFSAHFAVEQRPGSYFQR